jgi:hypothetical protein
MGVGFIASTLNELLPASLLIAAPITLNTGKKSFLKSWTTSHQEH